MEKESRYAHETRIALPGNWRSY